MGVRGSRKGYGQGRPTGDALRGHCPPALWKGATGAQVPLHTSIISNLLIYQHQFETNLLQLFTHTKNSEWFSIISVICFQVNIVAKHVLSMRKNVYYGYGCVFTPELKQTVLNSWYVKAMGVKTGENPGGAIAPPKTFELTLFTMIVNDSENSIRNTTPFGHPLFCHRSVVKYTSSLLK